MSRRKKILLWILALYLIAMMIYFMPSGFIMAPVVAMAVPVEAWQNGIKRIFPKALRVAFIVVDLLVFFYVLGSTVG